MPPKVTTTHRDVETVRSPINGNRQEKSLGHRDIISMDYIKRVFGEEIINQLTDIVKEGSNEAAYIKGGRISQALNRPRLALEKIDKGKLGDFDILVFGQKSISSLRSKYPERKGRNRITNYYMDDGQELDIADGEKMLESIEEAISDALKQIREHQEKSYFGLNRKQKRAYKYVLQLASTLKKDPEKVFIGTSLNSAKEAAIKVVKKDGNLHFSVCDPRNTLGSQEHFDREFFTTLDDLDFFVPGYTVRPRSLANASDLSIYRVVMEVATAFGEFKSRSHILWGIVPMALKVIRSDIEEKMPLAADGLLGRTVSFSKVRTYENTRAIDTLKLVKDFIALVIKKPNFTAISKEDVARKEEYASFGEYNKFKLRKELLALLEKDVKMTSFYMFSYIPALAEFMFPSINSLKPLVSYHKVFDRITQNTLDQHLYIGIEDYEGLDKETFSHLLTLKELSPLLARYYKKTAFFQNLLSISDHFSPHHWQVFFEQGRWKQGIEMQETPTSSLEKIVAVLLISSGKSNPPATLLTKVVEDCNRLTYSSKPTVIPGMMRCTVTKEGIISAIHNFYEQGLETIA